MRPVEKREDCVAAGVKNSPRWAGSEGPALRWIAILSNVQPSEAILTKKECFGYISANSLAAEG